MNTISQKNKRHFIRHSNSNAVASRCLLLLLGTAILMQAHSQSDKRLALADQYFAAGDYFTAAGLYGQFLKPAARKKTTSDFPLNSNRSAEGKTGTYKSKTEILYKQAESYRLAHYWKEAAAAYQECFQKDSATYAGALYWYAVCQRSTGDYASARGSINRFLTNFGSGHPLQQDATREKQTLGFIQQQMAKPDTVLYHVQKLQSSFGNEKGLFAPVAAGNQFLLTSTQTDSAAAGQSPYHNRIFNAAIKDGSIQNIEPVTIEGMDVSFNQGAVSLSPEGNYLYFTQWKKEGGKTISSIYYAKKTPGGWGRPVLLPAVNQTGFSSKQPFCAPGGKYLFFASDIPGGTGGFDIWYAPINADGTTGAPVNAGAVNTAGNEQAPFFHNATGMLVFASDRLPGMGGYDLFLSKGEGMNWKLAENMGYPVNSSRDDVYFFSNGKDNLLDNAFFSSDRGSECCLASYTVSKTPKKKMITGLVQECGTNEMLAGVEIILTDASGNQLHTKTDEQGRYRFAITGDGQRQVSVSKDQYLDKQEAVVVESVNETAWHTDTLYSAAVCMEKKKLVIKVENVVTVYFEFDQSKLKERARAQLDSIYNVLMEDAGATIQISGYTDGLGSVEYNKKLSDRRAKSCADYLTQKGIDPARISFESFGACCPVEMELINGRDNPDGRTMNRRALINISKSE